MSNLNRYQIYLDPESIESIDDLADELNISRTRLIRNAVERLADQYEKIINAKNKYSWKKNPLLKMAGIIKKTDTDKILSQNIDEIYQRD